MPTPSPAIIQILQAFAPAFTAPTFANALVLLYGAILTVGRRTVAAALRAVGLADHPHFGTYHRVLNRARWSPLRLSRLLLGLLVATMLAPDAPLVLLVDETLERRRGRRIAWRGYFRDPLRSTAGRGVTSAGVRWLCAALLVPLPWSARPWALPVLTVPALAPATSQRLGKRHRTVVERAQLLVRLVRRWQPGRQIALVGDGTYAAVPLGHTCRQLPGAVRLVSRLRLDAALYDPPAPQPPSKRGPKPKKGARQPALAARLADPATAWQTAALPWYGGQERTLDVATGTALWHRAGEAPLPIRWALLRDPHGRCPPTALFCTAQDASPAQLVAWFIGRWNIEVTVEEARAHLGVETQRQWTTRALGRTTPCLLGLFSLVTLLARALHPETLPTRHAAWYRKAAPTFAEALAAVRRHLWASWNCTPSRADADTAPILRPLWQSLHEAVCYAA
jgi:hypothetical protein